MLLIKTANVCFKTDLHCCGSANYTDWSRPNLVLMVPDSCCKTVSRACGVRDHPSNIYYTGCSHSLASMLARHLFLLGKGIVFDIVLVSELLSGFGSFPIISEYYLCKKNLYKTSPLLFDYQKFVLKNDTGPIISCFLKTYCMDLFSF